MRRLRAAFAFLTRVPVGDAAFDGADVGRATPLFPLVGATLGLAQGLALALPPVAGLPAAVQALLATGALVLLTGAFHLDALADSADGLGGGRTRADALRIMRDHVIGAYGAVALILALGLRIALLATLIERGAALPWLVAAGALARGATPLLGGLLPYARAEGGLGAAVTDHAGGAEIAGAVLLALVLGAAALGWGLVSAAAAVAVVTALAAAVCRRRLGGVTGDTLGAHTESAELAVLLAGVLAGAPA